MAWAISILCYNRCDPVRRCQLVFPDSSINEPGSVAVRAVGSSSLTCSLCIVVNPIGNVQQQSETCCATLSVLYAGMFVTVMPPSWRQHQDQCYYNLLPAHNVLQPWQLLQSSSEYIDLINKDGIGIFRPFAPTLFRVCYVRRIAVSKTFISSQEGLRDWLRNGSRVLLFSWLRAPPCPFSTLTGRQAACHGIAFTILWETITFYGGVLLRFTCYCFCFRLYHSLVAPQKLTSVSPSGMYCCF